MKLILIFGIKIYQKLPRYLTYNASNNELVRTQTFVKSAIVEVDTAPFKQWYLTHYGVDISRKKKTPAAKKDAAEVCFLATESLLLTLSSVRNWLHCSDTIFC
jgi:ribosomal protein S8E